YNKILTKADAVFKIIYLTDDNRINLATATIPVMGFIDMQNVNEDNICDVSYELKNILVKPNNAEEHSVYVEAEIEISCFVYQKREINIIKDLYSKNSELQFSQKNIRIMKEKNEIIETFNLRKQERIEEIKQNKIYDVEAKTTIISSQVEEGKVVYQGEVNFTFIYADEKTTRINVKNLVEPFEFAVTSKNINIKSKIETSIEISKKDFVVMSDNNIDIKLDLNFRLNVTQESEINIIESINETESRSKEVYSIVIYYTKIGDTLWNIAKKFGSTVEEIVKVNNIENPDVIMPGEQLFIPR
ncbi:MAG: LysM peptidoglycan-binding domain-containing protein, partial [Clostridia bacterium]